MQENHTTASELRELLFPLDVSPSGRGSGDSDKYVLPLLEVIDVLQVDLAMAVSDANQQVRRTAFVQSLRDVCLRSCCCRPTLSMERT